MTYELRILSGLHRGAILPLDEDQLSIGAHEDADVVLVDPGVESIHARLSKSESGWVLASSGGSIFSTDNSAAQEEIALARGALARVGHTWICISEGGDIWPELPVTAGRLSEHARETPATAHDDERAGKEPSRRPAKRVRRVAFIPALALAVTTAAAAYAFTAKPAPQPDMKPTNAVFAGGQNLESPASAEAGGSGGLRAAALSQEELKKAFRKKLTDAELIGCFDLKLEDQSWEMRGDLDDEEAARFERVLKSFMDEHRIRFPVRAQIVSAEGMLPFRVTQVISGANAGIVTADGHRMYVGDEFNGVRLQAIAGNRVKFAGRRKIEIVW